MKFGSREVANVVFRARSKMKLGSRIFYKDEPVIYFDSLKTSGLEGASTTVYAQGGQGNPRLIGWDGDRTLTLTMEDALMSPESLAILTGAGIIDPLDGTSGMNEANEEPIYVHTTSQVEVKTANTIVLPKGVKPCWNGGRASNAQNAGVNGYDFHKEADIFCMKMKDGEIVAEPCVPASVKYEESSQLTTITCHADGAAGATELAVGDVVLVDYYVKKSGKGSYQIEIAANKFAGNFYIEGETLFRRESDGMDMPAEFVIPNGKVQSNFNITMSNSGDPSTTTFTVDCFPSYTKFKPDRKVLAMLHVIGEDLIDEGKTIREACALG